MAQIPLKPASLGQLQASSEGDSFMATAAIKDLAGANVDFSAWDTLEAVFDHPLSGVEVTTAILATGNNDGTLQLQAVATVLSAAFFKTTQNLPYLVRGKVLTGDALQMIGTGTLSYSG